jgi:hypothetical protein
MKTIEVDDKTLPKEYPEYQLADGEFGVFYDLYPDEEDLYGTWLTFDDNGVGKSNLRFKVSRFEVRRSTKLTGRTLIRHIERYENGWPVNITWTYKEGT